MLAVALTPLLFGIGEFAGGMFSKRLSPWAVVGVLTAVSTLGALGWAIVTESLVWDQQAAMRGAVSGILYVIAYGLYFRALSQAEAGVVGAIITLSIIVPVVADYVKGDLPSAPQMAGIVAIVIGVIVISKPGSLGATAKKASLVALASAAVFGAQYLVLNKASAVDPDIAALSQFAMATLILAVAGLVTRSVGGMKRADLPLLVVTGLVFAAGGLCLTASLQQVNVAVVTAVMLTEPIVLAILGYFIQRDRLSGLQIGALAVVIGGAILASVG